MQQAATENYGDARFGILLTLECYLKLQMSIAAKMVRKLWGRRLMILLPSI